MVTIWLLLWGGLSIGCQTLAVLSGDLDFMRAGFGFALLAAVVPIYGLLGDWLYSQKKRARYRLPFWLRWDGWTIGHMSMGTSYNRANSMNSFYYDVDAARKVPISKMFVPLGT
jgi:hypothetical protein